MDSTAQTTPPPSEIFNETVSTGDAWIRHHKQPLRPHKSSPKVLPRVTHGFDSANGPCGLRILQRNYFHWGRMDSTAETAPAASEIINETASTRDPWIRQRRQPLRPQKSSTQLLAHVTHGFDSAKSPCGLQNHQQKQSRCRIRNHHRNCFHG